MSVQAAKDFVAKIKEDKSLEDSLVSADDDDARRKIAKDTGFDFTRDEMKEAISEISGKQLSDDDLDSVAGGVGAGWIAGGVVVGASAIGSAVAAA